MEMRGCTIFQQDSAPCYKAKTVINWCAQNRITLLQLPGNSADLNPIENLWEIVKDKVAKKTPGNLD